MREKQQGSENLKVEKAEGLNQQSPEPQGLETMVVQELGEGEG